MHKFDPEHWERLVGEERRARLPVSAILNPIDVREGMVVADIGAGPGYFTLPLAERVGPRGRVYALDIEPRMLEALRSRGVPPNVEVLQSGESTLPLPDQSVDLAFLAFVYHELGDRPAMLAEIRRILRPGGRLVVADWVPREEEIGPPLHERIAEGVVTAEMEAAGFEVTTSFAANPSTYCVVGAV